MSRSRRSWRRLAVLVGVAALAFAVLAMLWQSIAVAGSLQASTSAGTEALVLINEFDSETPGTDTAEFIELYDGGAGSTALDGHVLVLYEGTHDQVYRAIDLDAYSTNELGYFLAANAGVAGANVVFPDNVLNRGPAAIALYMGTPAEFPTGAAVTTTNLVDAVVYGQGTPDDGLLVLLEEGQPQVNENSAGLDDWHSSQRCQPERAARTTEGFQQQGPTPKTANRCNIDEAPAVAATSPISGAIAVAPDAQLVLTFTEDVVTTSPWFTLECTTSGTHAAIVENEGNSRRLTPEEPFTNGETCTATILANQVRDADPADPPDFMASDHIWRFAIAVADGILINEFDSNTPGTDEQEFIELYDGGTGNTGLDGLAVVLFNGTSDTSYAAFDLAGEQTSEQGFYLLGNAAITSAQTIFSNSLLQNGPDAVALYAGAAAAFPNGTAVTTTNLIDAVVYGATDDPELLALLEAGEAAVDENARGNESNDANQRCPDGSGGARRTANFLQNLPSPGRINHCELDDAPAIVSVSPAPAAADVPLTPTLRITFTEPVAVGSSWLTLSCSTSGFHEVTTITSTGEAYTAEVQDPLVSNESCTATVAADKVNDVDVFDPPDNLSDDYRWAFSTSAPPAPDNVLINELDANTPGSDQAEFIELYDGGVGNTQLNSLVLAFINGTDDSYYAAFELSDQQTDGAGYFVIGNENVAGATVTFTNSLLQNGPDAVGLYAGSLVDFTTGTAFTTTNLIDAVVYGRRGTVTPSLLQLLAPDQSALDEDARGVPELHSLQRCPDGAGGRRHTDSFLLNPATPGSANECVQDTAPAVVGTYPVDAAVAVPLTASLQISFSEAVSLTSSAIALACQDSGDHVLSVSGNGTNFVALPASSFSSAENCTAKVRATGVGDLDADDPPEHPLTDYQWQFMTAAAPVATNIIINELDADTPGADEAEFMELYDGGGGQTDLTGLTLVLYNGSTDTSYRTIPLNGHTTDADGYFLVGSASHTNADLVIPTGAMQNGADAVALYAAGAAIFPNGTPVTTQDLLDAVVYGTADETDQELLVLLNDGQPQVDEDAGGAKEMNASQRCPNGGGGQRNTSGFLTRPPTPKADNNCERDDAPAVVQVSPSPGAVDVLPSTALTVRFSEVVDLSGGWLTLDCSRSGTRGAADMAVVGGPKTYTVTPATPFSAGEQCAATVVAASVRDGDSIDPPNRPEADFTWSFTIRSQPVARNIVINELDVDTPGSDEAEFIELYDGGTGKTDLAGLVVVFFNGSSDTSYRAVGLDGYTTDGQGYFVMGNTGIAEADLMLPNSSLQNGSDAVAVYAGLPADFPSGTPVTTVDLIDAIVYGTGDEPDEELLAHILPGQPQVDEDADGGKDVNASQRCGGGQRQTAGFIQNPPTPGRTNNCAVDAPPQVVAFLPAAEASDVPPETTLAVDFSEPVALADGWLTLACTSGGDVSLSITGQGTSYQAQPASPLRPLETCTATVDAGKVSDVDGLAHPLPADVSWSFTVGLPSFGACGDEATPIHDLRREDLSTVAEGFVVLEGVVSGSFQGADALSGFFIQEEFWDADNDPSTSEGIFINDLLTASVTVEPGDVVRVQGQVDRGAGALELGPVTKVQICGRGERPAPIVVTLPFSPTASWQHYEAMLVAVSQTLVATGSDGWGSAGQIVLAPDERLVYPTQIVPPGPEAVALLEQQRRSLIILDDGSRKAFPEPLPPLVSAENTIRLGAQLEQLTGVITETDGGYAIHPTEAVAVTHVNARPAAPPAVEGDLLIASFSLNGYFNGDGQGGGFPTPGAATPEAYARQRDKAVAALLALNADAIALTGIENDGIAAGSAVTDLVDQVNVVLPADQKYSIAAAGGGVTGTATTVLLLYRGSSLLPVGVSTSTDLGEDMVRPLAQTFAQKRSGARFTLVVAALRGRDRCPAAGEPNAAQNDGQGCWSHARRAAAAKLKDWIDGDPTGQGTGNVLLVGNFNAFAQEDPLVSLREAGLVDVFAHSPDAARYSAVLDGRAGALSHALATPSLAAQIGSADIWHINADEPAALDYRLSNQPALYQPDAYRAAPQDPLLIGVDLATLTASFSSNGPVPIGEVSRFTNTSAGPAGVAFLWDFGDGSAPSSERDPDHRYEQIGTYEVTLTATTPWGKRVSVQQTHEVVVARAFMPSLLVTGAAVGERSIGLAPAARQRRSR